MPALPQYKCRFIEFLVRVEAIQFGTFTLKSGRISPYFFNSALFNTGALIRTLGGFYAAAIHDQAPECTLVFGPAYKGIPLCVTTVIALQEAFNHECGYVFNRKEAKSHGDKGVLTGMMPQSSDHLVMVDDVMTDGSTKKEAITLLQQHYDAKFSAVLVAVDRMEHNTQGVDAKESFVQETGIPFMGIVSIEEVCRYLRNREVEGKTYLPEAQYQQIRDYLKEFSTRAKLES